MAQQTVTFGGKVFRRGNSYLVLPTISFGDAEAMAADLDKIEGRGPDGKLTAADQKALMWKVILAAARLNYPDITIDRLKGQFTTLGIFDAYNAATVGDTANEVYEAPGELEPAASGSMSPGAISAGA
jgi:hypothetical protein